MFLTLQDIHYADGLNQHDTICLFAELTAKLTEGFL